MSHIPKAILYYSPSSAWSTSALLALEEKGYGEDELDLRIVDIGKAENLSMSFLRINPKGTVPTLVVPLQNTLAPEDEHRFKAITETKDILEFLDKSRSAASPTHTTSSAPAPALAPATIALSSTSALIIELLHSSIGDPSSLLYYNYGTDEAAFSQWAQVLTPYIRARRDAVTHYKAENEVAEIRASEKTKKLWDARLLEMEALLTVYTTGGKEDTVLDVVEKIRKEEFRAQATEFWGSKLKKVLVTLDKEMQGPFALGDQISIADLHLGPWLARIAYLVGASPNENGDSVIAKIEARIGDDFSLPKSFQSIVVPRDPAAAAAAASTSGEENVNGASGAGLAIAPGAKRAKLAAFWDEIRVRPGWKKVYGEKLH